MVFHSDFVLNFFAEQLCQPLLFSIRILRGQFAVNCGVFVWKRDSSGAGACIKVGGCSRSPGETR